MKRLTEPIERPRPTTSVGDHAGRGTRRSLGLRWTYAAPCGRTALPRQARERLPDRGRLQDRAGRHLLDETGGLVRRRLRRSTVGRRDEHSVRAVGPEL